MERAVIVALFVFLGFVGLIVYLLTLPKPNASQTTTTNITYVPQTGKFLASGPTKTSFNNLADVQKYCNAAPDCLGFIQLGSIYQSANSVSPQPNGGVYYLKTTKTTQS